MRAERFTLFGTVHIHVSLKDHKGAMSVDFGGYEYILAKEVNLQIWNLNNEDQLFL